MSDHSLLYFAAAVDDGGGSTDNWNFMICSDPVKSPPPSPTYQHSVFLTGLRHFLLPNQQRQSSDGYVVLME